MNIQYLNNLKIVPYHTKMDYRSILTKMNIGFIEIKIDKIIKMGTSKARHSGLKRGTSWTLTVLIKS